MFNTVIKLIILIILIFNCNKCYSSSESVIEIKNLPNNNIINKLKQLDYKYDNIYKLSFLLKNIERLSIEINNINDNNCRNDAKLIFNNIQNLTKWAYKFYDSSAKFPDGILTGSIYQFGNFDECLNIGYDKYDNIPINIKGKYCLSELIIKIPNYYYKNNNSVWINFQKKYQRYDNTINKLYWGICTPASCNANEIENIFKRLFIYVFDDTEIILNPIVNEKKCYVKERLSPDVYDSIYMILILGITILIIIGTLSHGFIKKQNKEQSNNAVFHILNAFSIISNIKKLCGPSHDSELNLDCISGIKFIAMFLIISGHCLVFIVGGPILNTDYWQLAVGKLENAIFLNSPLLVDTFLFISGFLFARILLRELDKRKSINFISLYIFRYIRLTPAYLVIVGLYVTWLSKLDTGPLWSRMIEEKNRCQISWWTNIMYINNYIHTDQLCMFQSWYLSVDTQLFIIAPVIIYPLWRWQKYGEIILAAITSLSIVVPFTVTLINHLDPTLMIYTSEIEDISNNEYFKTTYIKTHMRATPYCIGLVYGYILYRIQTSNHKLSQKSVIIGWIFGIVSLIISMYSIVLFYVIRKNYTPIEAAIYSSLHRVLWSLGTGWIILACVTNNIVRSCKNFLKWRPFVTLSRLTYSAYLVNGLVELHGISTTRTPQYLDTVNLFSKVMSHFVMTFIGAFLLSIMFEAPVLSLERIFLRPGNKTMENSNKNQSEETSTTET